MSLDSLPEELLLIILKRLDMKSVCNFYEAGNHHVRNVISTQGAVKKCDFSLNNMATAQSLRLGFFRGVSQHLQELNMCGVPDLNKTILLQAMRKLKSIVTLDVSYTNITIMDLLDIYGVCPTIQNISIDYKFFIKANPKKVFSWELLTKCQDMFSNFKNVNFVGSMENLILSELPQLLLQKAQLNSLTYSVAMLDRMFTYYKYFESKTIYCNNFTIYLYTDSVTFCVPLKVSDLFKKISFNYEYLLISTSVYCTPLLQKFVRQHFGVDAQSYSYGYVSSLPALFMIWNKDTNNFNQLFYSNLLLKIKVFFPTIITSWDDSIEPDTLNNWICVTHLGLEHERREMEEYGPAFKKMRKVSPNVSLDYDRLLQSIQKVQLSISFYDHVRNPVTLSSNCNFLKKLTFLSLTGSVRFSGDFFNVLFRCCENITTLDVEVTPVARSTLPISRTIALSRSLKNLRIVDTRIDFKTLFSSLAQCRTLQNVQVQDVSQISNDISNPDTLFKQCDDLYYLSIQAKLTESVQRKKLQMLNNSKLRYGRNYLRIELFTSPGDFNYTYTPFVDVFKVHSIKVSVNN